MPSDMMMWQWGLKPGKSSNVWMEQAQPGRELPALSEAEVYSLIQSPVSDGMTGRRDDACRRRRQGIRGRSRRNEHGQSHFADSRNQGSERG